MQAHTDDDSERQQAQWEGRPLTEIPLSYGATVLQDRENSEAWIQMDTPNVATFDPDEEEHVVAYDRHDGVYR